MNDSIIVLGNPKLIVNKTLHKRYRLPDHQYLYNIRVVSGTEYHSIYDAANKKYIPFTNPRTGELTEAFSFSTFSVRRDEISLYAQTLAHKKYRRPPDATGGNRHAQSGGTG